MWGYSTGVVSGSFSLSLLLYSSAALKLFTQYLVLLSLASITAWQRALILSLDTKANIRSFDIESQACLITVRNFGYER